MQSFLYNDDPVSYSDDERYDEDDKDDASSFNEKSYPSYDGNEDLM